MKKLWFLTFLLLFSTQFTGSAYANEFHKAVGDSGVVNGGKVLNLVGPLGPNELTPRVNEVDVSFIKGIAGATGATDLPLAIGLVGPQGPIGKTGPQGPVGPIGETGLQGASGLQGAAGLQGVSGATGAQGVIGISGIAGSIGPQGPVGVQGAQGVQGSTGAQGSVGPMGPTGGQGATGAQGPIGLTGPASTVAGPRGLIGETGPQGGFGDHGSFSSDVTQNPGVATRTAVTFNATDAESTSGISLRENSKIFFEKAGTYNISFSAQMRNLEGTDPDSDTAIWLSKKGVDVSLTTGWITFDKNNTKSVEAWNYFLTVAADDYFELMWWSRDGKTEMSAEPRKVEADIPSIPSVIVTVNQVG